MSFDADGEGQGQRCGWEPAGLGGGRVEGERLLPPGSFDTVVDTFGLCSHDDPVAALQVISTVTACRGGFLLSRQPMLQRSRVAGWPLMSANLSAAAMGT